MSKVSWRVAGVVFVVATCAAALTGQDVAALKAKAESGDATAQYNLAVAYENGGEGVEKNPSEAVVWFQKAAMQGLAPAEFALGNSYNFGLGVTQDFLKAAEWYRKAVDQGDADAEMYLGQLYEDGEGVEQSYTEAANLYRKAAEQGNPTAQFNLGTMYQAGQGVPKDDVQAAFWTRKAAEQGLPVAQNNLGLMYEEGRGVPKDSAQAEAWYRKSINQGDATAQHNLTAFTSIQQNFPLQIIIQSARDSGLSGISQEAQTNAANIGMEVPYFVIFQGTINGEDHWVFGCRKENLLRESVPCTTLPIGQYRGRWIHDHYLIQVIGGSAESPTMRFLTVSDNPKSPPTANDPVLGLRAFNFPLILPNGKTLKDYPVLVHVYGGYSLDLPVGQLPAHSRCNVYTWSAYQTSVNCAAYPAVEIHRGYVNLDVSMEAIDFASLHCEAKWRWSHCSMLDPGLYYARIEKNRLVLLTHNQNGKPQEVGFSADLPRDAAESPVK